MIRALTGNRKAVSNFSHLVVAGLCEKALLYILFMVMAREMGPQVFGQFFLAFAFCNIVFIFNELGLTTTVCRNIACDPSRSSYYFRNFLGIRLVSTVLIFLVLLGLVAFVDYSHDVVVTLYILSIYFVLSYLSHPFVGLFRGLERMRYFTVMTVVDRGGIALLGIGAILAGGGIFHVSSVFIIGGGLRLVVAYLIAKKARLAQLGAGFDIRCWSALLTESWPIAAVMVLTLISLRIDTLILSFFDYSEETIGFYNAAQVIFTLWLLPATAYAQAVFPLLSRGFAGQQTIQQQKSRVIKLYFGVIAVAAVLSLCLYMNSSFLIGTVYGQDFDTASGLLEMFAWSVFFSSVNIFSQWLLIAAGNGRRSLVLVSVMTFMSLLLSLVLVPEYGASGAVMASVGANLATFLFSIFWLRPLLPTAT